jgi:DNA-directed RNA polymerase subunit RPC12/RpoP
MPLIDCPDCHYRVSESATLCVNCGRPMKAAKTSYTERMSELQFQSLKLWVYLGAAILIVYFAFRFYEYIFDK